MTGFFQLCAAMKNPDQDTVIRAVEDARRILGEYIDPGPSGARRTVERLLAVLDRDDVVHALDRIKRRRLIRLVEWSNPKKNPPGVNRRPHLTSSGWCQFRPTSPRSVISFTCAARGIGYQRFNSEGEMVVIQDIVERESIESQTDSKASDLFSIAVFCGIGLLVSLSVLLLDQYVPGDWF
jgi:hypothetical protein